MCPSPRILDPRLSGFGIGESGKGLAALITFAVGPPMSITSRYLTSPLEVVTRRMPGWGFLWSVVIAGLLFKLPVILFKVGTSNSLSSVLGHELHERGDIVYSERACEPGPWSGSRFEHRKEQLFTPDPFADVAGHGRGTRWYPVTLVLQVGRYQ